jgi:hypothetical protein
MPPKNDFGFVNFEPMVIIGGQAGCGTNGAVDVEHHVARSADQMVVVVTDSIFISRGGPSWLDPTNEVLVDQDAERVVHSLARNRTENDPDIVGQLVGGGVSMGRKCPHDRKALSGNLHAVVT